MAPVMPAIDIMGLAFLKGSKPDWDLQRTGSAEALNLLE